MTADGDRLLLELREEFRGLSAQRLVEMEGLLARLAEGRDDEALRTLRRHAHGLVGSGGSVGLPEVTRIARLLEAACGDRLDAGESPLPDDLAAWAGHLRGIRAALAPA